MIKYKTLSFAAVHFTVAFTVVWALTGSWMIGGLVAMVEPAFNTVAYMLHEMVWERHLSRSARRGTINAPQRASIASWDSSSGPAMSGSSRNFRRLLRHAPASSRIRADFNVAS